MEFVICHQFFKHGNIPPSSPSLAEHQAHHEGDKDRAALAVQGQSQECLLENLSLDKTSLRLQYLTPHALDGYKRRMEKEWKYKMVPPCMLEVVSSKAKEEVS